MTRLTNGGRIYPCARRGVETCTCCSTCQWELQPFFFWSHFLEGPCFFGGIKGKTGRLPSSANGQRSSVFPPVFSTLPSSSRQLGSKIFLFKPIYLNLAFYQFTRSLQNILLEREDQLGGVNIERSHNNWKVNRDFWQTRTTERFADGRKF